MNDVVRLFIVVAALLGTCVAGVPSWSSQMRGEWDKISLVNDTFKHSTFKTSTERIPKGWGVGVLSDWKWKNMTAFSPDLIYSDLSITLRNGKYVGSESTSLIVSGLVNVSTGLGVYISATSGIGLPFINYNRMTEKLNTSGLEPSLFNEFFFNMSTSVQFGYSSLSFSDMCPGVIVIQFNKTALQLPLTDLAYGDVVGDGYIMPFACGELSLNFTLARFNRQPLLDEVRRFSLIDGAFLIIYGFLMASYLDKLDDIPGGFRLIPFSTFFMLGVLDLFYAIANVLTSIYFVRPLSNSLFVGGLIGIMTVYMMYRPVMRADQYIERRNRRNRQQTTRRDGGLLILYDEDTPGNNVQNLRAVAPRSSVTMLRNIFFFLVFIAVPIMNLFDLGFVLAQLFWVPLVYYKIKKQSFFIFRSFMVLVSIFKSSISAYFFLYEGNVLELERNSLYGYSCIIFIWIPCILVLAWDKMFGERKSKTKSDFLDIHEHIEKESKCPICFLELNPEQGDVVVTVCNHVFHRRCLHSWIEKKPECPICREEIDFRI
ncbi:hypothetical protein PCE1_003559 [Barthelona sp. PCE]